MPRVLNQESLEFFEFDTHLCSDDVVFQATECRYFSLNESISQWY